MKKIIALALSAVLALSMVACGGSDNKSSFDVAAAAKTIEEANPIRMSTPIDEFYMAFIGFGEIDFDTEEATLSEDVVSFAGSYCPVTPGVDIILVVEAAEGKVDAVKAVMENKKAELVAANENYVGALLEKAKAGRIVVKGNVVTLVIAGDDMVIEDQGVEKAYEPVDAAIEKAFN